MTATAPARIMTEAEINEAMPEAMRIARGIAYPMSKRINNLDAEELSNIGYMAIAEVFRTHQPSRGNWRPAVKFKVRNRIRDYFRAMDHLSRKHRREAGTTPGVISLEKWLDDGNQIGSLDAGFVSVERQMDAKRFLSLVSVRSALVLRKYYLCGMTDAGIGADLAITEARVYRIRVQALLEIRQRASLRPGMTTETHGR
jgi:RNA polymerase sigma factor (sigma-70 family)